MTLRKLFIYLSYTVFVILKVYSRLYGVILWIRKRRLSLVNVHWQTYTFTNWEMDNFCCVLRITRFLNNTEHHTFSLRQQSCWSDVKCKNSNSSALTSTTASLSENNTCMLALFMHVTSTCNSHTLTIADSTAASGCTTLSSIPAVTYPILSIAYASISMLASSKLQLHSNYMTRYAD